MRARIHVGLHLDEQQLTLDCLRIKLNDLQDVDQLVELLGYLLEWQLIHVDDDRHARDAFDLSRTYGERLNVEPAT